MLEWRGTLKAFYPRIQRRLILSHQNEISFSLSDSTRLTKTEKDPLYLTDALGIILRGDNQSRVVYLACIVNARQAIPIRQRGGGSFTRSIAFLARSD